MLDSPRCLLAPRCAEVDLGTWLLDGTHLAILRVEHDDVTVGRYHVLVQLDAVGLWVAPIHIGLTIVVDEDAGVDVVPVLLLPYQRLTQRIAERTVGGVCDQHANAMTMQRSIEVVLAIALYGLYGPGTVLTTAPLEILQRSDSAMFGPVDHIGGRPQQPVVHKETGRVTLIGVGDVFWRSIVRRI